MQKSLVIVESPAKANTINQYLGRNYIVKSSVGHVRDLITTKNKKKNKKFSRSQHLKDHFFIEKIGINPYNDWEASYHILPGKEKIVSELKKIAKEAKTIYLATDLDREGEAIAWHLKEVIGGDSDKFKRVVFNEITKYSIKQAFKDTTSINMNKVYAQQARRFMDRIVGYMISPLLWKKISRGLSAGRVQSVAVRIISDREHAIKIFVPEEYWTLNISLLFKENKKIIMNVTHFKNMKFKPINKIEINTSIEKIKKSSFFVKKCEKKIFYQASPAPFITVTLQQSANIILGFSVKKTMFLAQKLYEEGYITYIRTDSYYLSKHAIKMARIHIKKHYGENYLPRKPNIYSKIKFSQEAHEAIRPSDIEIKDIELKKSNKDSQKLYTLIWKRFLSSQMTKKKYTSMKITVIANQFTLQKIEKETLFDGWTKIWTDAEDSILASSILKTGDCLFIDQIIPVQKFTQPPSRFNEASLVRYLEKKGIGRPSTYSVIASKIQQKGYVKIIKNKFYAQKMGEILSERLQTSFHDLIDYNFTANMEKQLDKISENKICWKKMLTKFFNNFLKKLDKAKKHPSEGGMQSNLIVMTTFNCPICSENMGIINTITGVFLRCSRNVDISEQSCKNTVCLFPWIDLNQSDWNNTIKQKTFNIYPRCKKCNMLMDSYLINNKSKIHICGNNPNCTGYIIENGTFDSPAYLSDNINCDKCGNKMMPKIGRFGKFLICINSLCKNTRKILSNGDIADPVMEPIPFPDLLCTQSNAFFVLKEGVSGIFLAANNFPKSRETRSPLVEELEKFQHLLPKKIHYLSTGPKVDCKGNKTIVCFDKKTKTHYITSKKSGKLTGWSAFFINKKWCITG